MATKNPITGDLIKSKVGNNQLFRIGWENIFGKKPKKKAKPKKKMTKLELEIIRRKNQRKKVAS